MDEIDGLLKQVELDLRSGKKRVAVKRIALALQNAIKDNNADLELRLLWLTVAILEHNSWDYEAASEQHFEVTKRSQLYDLVELAGREHPIMKKIFFRR